MGTTRAIYGSKMDGEVKFDVGINQDLEDWQVLETFDLEEGDSIQRHSSSGNSWDLFRNGRWYTADQVLGGEAGPLNLQAATVYRQHMANELRRVAESTPDLALTPAEKSEIDRLIAGLNPTDEEAL